MASTTDDYVDTQIDDSFFPCKGCGEILEEGKAFELAGNRWHIDCFRCNTCGTLLDGDADLLLLGDGSLICNNCTYSCNACGSKIEDLAILTGDQAFCATCFRCRNCKRKIDNLRYARTSQGIFCMDCHESLMARRRKKSKATAQVKLRDKDSSPLVVEKSLPALPPNAIPPNAFSNDRVDPDSDTPTELSPRPRALYPARTDSSSRSSSHRSRSPERQPESMPPREINLSLPQPGYYSNRRSAIVQPSDSNGDADSFLIPVALNSSPVLSPPSPLESLAMYRSIPGSTSTPKYDLDSLNDSTRQAREVSSRFSSSTLLVDQKSQAFQGNILSHVAFQDKGMQSSSDPESSKPEVPTRKASKSIRNSEPRASLTRTSSADETPSKSNVQQLPASDFRLQDAPKNKKAVSPPINISNAANATSTSRHVTQIDPPDDEGGSTDRSVRTGDKSPSNYESAESDDSAQRPDSHAENNRTPSRREHPPGARNAYELVSTRRSTVFGEIASNGETNLTRFPIGEPKMSDAYMQPRAPPVPPTSPPKKPITSPAGIRSVPSPKASPKLLRWSAGGDFTMDEDMARILGTDEGSTSLLRRVSNAVRHGRNGSIDCNHNQSRIAHSRSVSETTRGTASPRWPKTILSDGVANGHTRDISSPISTTSTDDPAFLRRQLKNSEHRVAELERQFHTEKDLKSLNKKLDEKRKTVSDLDTQAEIMIRQLNVLAGHVEGAKERQLPIDSRDLGEATINEFMRKLEEVKVKMTAAIEHERDVLVEEKNQAVSDRDRALLEFQRLSAENAQLFDLNNDLTHQIQERFKAHAVTAETKADNGLGIYGPKNKVAGSLSNAESASTLMETVGYSGEQEDQVIEGGPTVVQVRRGQARKFNWKKGSKAVAQNVAKGVNRAVVAFQQQGQDHRDKPNSGIYGDSIGLPYNMTLAPIDFSASFATNGQLSTSSTSQTVGAGSAASTHTGTGVTSGSGAGGGLARSQGEQAGRQGFTFFNRKNNTTLAKSLSTNNFSTPTIVPDAATTLFGSELAHRAEHERRQIPSVVIRCIEEVELRGMDVEGIYRKTGGNSQIRAVQEGFDHSDAYDISDPSLDITAVTSVLKQYFRKLPTPLLTYDVYERILESNAIANEAERCDHLRRVVASMPQVHQDCLEFLVFHLGRVAQRESENLMPSKNLALVFAPTIMRDHSLEREMTDMHSKNIAVQFIIDNLQHIFVG